VLALRRAIHLGRSLPVGQKHRYLFSVVASVMPDNPPESAAQKRSNSAMTDCYAYRSQDWVVRVAEPLCADPLGVVIDARQGEYPDDTAAEQLAADLSGRYGSPKRSAPTESARCNSSSTRSKHAASTPGSRCCMSTATSWPRGRPPTRRCPPGKATGCESGWGSVAPQSGPEPTNDARTAPDDQH
jgi:hypothetical protein